MVANVPSVGGRNVAFWLVEPKLPWLSQEKGIPPNHSFPLQILHLGLAGFGAITFWDIPTASAVCPRLLSSCRWCYEHGWSSWGLALARINGGLHSPISLISSDPRVMIRFVYGPRLCAPNLIKSAVPWVSNLGPYPSCRSLSIDINCVHV